MITQNISEWVDYNHLRFNISKTKAVIFKAKNKILNGEIKISLKGQKVDIVDNIKFLGVYFQSNLSWDFHIKSIVAKLRCVVGILQHVKSSLSYKAKLHVYYSLF